MFKLKGSKYSVLGLLLLIASGITAAIHKSNKDEKRSLNGRLVQSTNANSYTCITEFAPFFRNCHNTESRGFGAASCTTEFIGDSETTQALGNTTHFDEN